MDRSKRGLVDTVKRVAFRAGTRGARALVEGAVLTARTVDALQARLCGTHAAQHATAARGGSAPSTTELRRAAVPPRGVIESGRPMKPATTRRKSPARTASAVETTGRKSLPSRAPAAKRGTPRTPPVKVKRGQKHRH
ncbi:hypothetical protein [Myxococcus sp. RHSTA-1-4]|uniref:hypothetical protein n=1 Tax=Myxococcus sp. RHSTA-1-4 TaxID=2874601 RepID=UPI001CBF712B|nr:hypothetical protein [Myxococcus sp. RHSTA-1-4]MBZ4419184.1 hypothetical protein [Myxococcus sp. RHSTA-1-4]